MSILLNGYGPGKWYHSKGPYNEARRQYECVLFYVDGLYREEVVFEIEYEMNNAAFKYADCSELYLCMYSEDTIKHLDSFKGQILFPDKDMPSEGNYYAHTYGTNSSNFPFYESDTLNPGYTTFSFELDESDLKFNPYYQYIEFALVSYGDDKHIFTEYAPNNQYSQDNVLDELKYEHDEYEATYKKYKNIKFIIFLIGIAGTYLVIEYSFVKYDKKTRKKYPLYKSTLPFEYFREIPSNLDPNFATTLVFSKHKLQKDKGDIYSAIMLSLVRKGYIELKKINAQKDWSFNNVKVVIKYNPTQLGPTIFNPDTNEPKIILTSKGYKLLEENPIPEKSNSLEERISIERTTSIDHLERQGDHAIIKDTKESEPLSPSEAYYFNLIVKHANGTQITMSKLQSKISTYYTITDSYIKKIENSIVNIGLSQEYFQTSKYNEPRQQTQKIARKFLITGILFATLVNFISSQTRFDLAFGAFSILGIGFIISGIHLNRLSKDYVLLTQFGQDEYYKWRGLYNFLKSDTLMNERTVIELPLWEQYLVYATAFGISKKVIKALKIRCPDMAESPMLSNNYYYSKSFYSTSRSLGTTTHRASYAARSGGYGGYSSYGGYGGGGRGGGGGRRRSLKIFN